MAAPPNSWNVLGYGLVDKAWFQKYTSRWLMCEKEKSRPNWEEHFNSALHPYSLNPLFFMKNAKSKYVVLKMVKISHGKNFPSKW